MNFRAASLYPIIIAFCTVAVFATGDRTPRPAHALHLAEFNSAEMPPEATASKVPATSLAQELAHLDSLILVWSYAETESLARALRTQVEAEHGRESVEAARVIDRLVQAIDPTGTGRTEEALPLALQALHMKGVFRLWCG